MADDAKPEHETPEERDPLSATAMFLRALEEAPQANSGIGDQAGERSGVPGSTSRFISDAAPPAGEQTGYAAPKSAEPGEFTQVFGETRKKQISADEAAAARARATQPAPQSAPTGDVRQNGPPGEFTRIFVEGSAAAASRAEQSVPPKRDETPARARGFSSPGVSDAASAESTFTQFFKAGAGTPAATSASAAERGVGQQGILGAESSRRPSAAAPAPSERRSHLPNPDPSVTGLIAHLSSERGAPASTRESQVVPYRDEPWRSSTPEVRSSPPAGVDAGGVTQILQRLSSEPPKPVIEGPPIRPQPAPKAGPGEFTRMISRDEVNAAMGTPAGTPSASPAPAASASPFVPVTPAMPQVKMPAVAAQSIPATAPAAAAPQFVAPGMPVIPAMPATSIPGPPLPAARPLAPAGPKSKLEAMVPLLLLVNTFLLVVLLLVVIFLIRVK